MPTIAEMSIEDRLATMARLGIWSPEQAARFDAARNSSYCLVRIDGVGERWKCRECGCRHAHFTKFCIPIPYRGLLNGLHAYWANFGTARTQDLSPAQREQLDALAPIFGGRPVPLATSHPEMAAALGTADRDADVGAVILGSIDPISRAKARLYVELINAKAGHTVLTL